MTVFLPKEILPTSSFACGPSQMLQSIRNTPLWQTLSERNHRAKDITSDGLYKEAENNLRKLMHLPPHYKVIFFLGGATVAMEAVLWNLAEKKISGLSFGAFSKRWCEQLPQRMDSAVSLSIQTPKNGALFPEQMPDKDADLILLTPNETATGVQIPNDYLNKVWEMRGEDTLVAWDATSCAGGRALPNDSFDVMLFGLQKCFGAGGGSCVVILSPKALERAEKIKSQRKIPFSFDLSEAARYADLHQTFNTPSTTNIWLFNEACKWMLANGAIEGMDRLCRMHAQFLEEWALKSDYLMPLVEDKLFRSYTSYTLKITDPALQANDINRALAATGLFNLQDGIKAHPSAPENSLRIACFPFVDPHGINEYERLTKCVDYVVSQLKNNHR